MRFYSALFTCFLFLSITSRDWETDFETAVHKAKSEHKLILVNFSGSDWCAPCIRLHQEILEEPGFKDFANKHLVLVNANFPRLKRNQLSKEQQKKNEKLADQYNPKGIFPFTLLLDPEGKILRSWEGYPEMTPIQFIGQIKAVLDARK